MLDHPITLALHANLPIPAAGTWCPTASRAARTCFCQIKGRRTANTTVTQHCQCNSAPRLGSTRTWGPSGPEERQKHPCEQSRTWPPASLPAFTPHQTSRARRAPEIRETRSTTPRDRNPQGCDSSSTSHKPCALLSGKISQLGVPPAPAAGSCWQTGSCQVQEGSTWLSQVGQTALPGDKGQHTHGHDQCPGPARSLHTRLGMPDPQAPTSPCARAPGTHPALLVRSCLSPGHQEELPVPGFPSPAPRTSPIQADCGILALQPSQASEQKTEVPRAGVPRVRGAPGTAGWQGQPFLMGSVDFCPLSRPSHQPSWQTSPLTHPYQGPGPAWPDGRGADGLFKSFPFALPQDTLKGKPWKSLFYSGPMRASSTAHIRRGCAGGNSSRRSV